MTSTSGPLWVLTLGEYSGMRAKETELQYTVPSRCALVRASVTGGSMLGVKRTPLAQSSLAVAPGAAIREATKPSGDGYSEYSLITSCL